MKFVIVKRQGRGSGGGSACSGVEGRVGVDIVEGDAFVMISLEIGFDGETQIQSDLLQGMGIERGRDVVGKVICLENT